MAIENRSTLKTEFSAGTAATETKFANLIDSSYNKYEDSVMFGPAGITGKFGLLGPTGGTYNGILGPSGSTFFRGLFLSSSTTGPTSTTDPGATGEVILVIGATPAMYVCNGTNWFRFAGATSW